MQGKKKETSIRIMKTMQKKRSRRKWCVLFEVHIYSDKGKDVEDVEVLSRYTDLATVLGCVSSRYFKVVTSKRSGLFH